MADPIITDEGKLSAWERWELAEFDAPAGQVRPGAPKPPPEEPEPAVKMPTVEEIDQMYQDAQRQGYDTGYAEGQVKSREEARRLAVAANRLEQSLDGFDAAVADEILALAVALARETVRSELSARPDALLNVVREALAQLPHQHAAIYLNPEDASLLRSYMGDQLAHAGHRIHEQADLTRGDCVLEAGGTHVDARVATRWSRVIAGLGLEAAWAEETPEEPAP
jgi:flagellar assembly protein FliH